eukprot:CAMPEP_0176434962 /NCGR_PEP_ID=MMETSP0127-20121128/17015_1 /TAXON_ID=938130 /ORGANISM="Platyophrya macrostoma, Strain WH" /LENGTH=654 /DNA_ID=CAMNT_0017817851 /DNA_START=470 /DNA_END=2437 /DNA_ORIENTATION=+
MGLLAQIVLIYGFSFYITEKFLRQDYLEKRKIYDDSEAVKSILDDITEGIVIIEKKSNILYLNQPVQKMFKLENKQNTEELFNKIKIKSIMPSGSASSHFASQFRKSFEQDQLLSETYEQFSETLLRNSFQGEDLWIVVEAYADILALNDVTASDLKENNSRTRNYVIKFTPSFYHNNRVIVANINDTTDRDSVLSLQDNSKYKTRLLASVSHELRTPLNGSINFTEQALLDPNVPQHCKDKYILPALRSNKLLLSLINDILDFSQIEANKIRLAFENKNVVQTAKECFELLEIQAQKKGIELVMNTDLKNQKEELLFTDHNRLKQVLLNLLSNAVKFTFEGSVTLNIEKIENQSQRGIKFLCKDTGIGISEENQKKLFQAFEKFEYGDKVAINSTGVGLGLVISNSIVQRLNHQRIIQGENAIKFESEQERGSAFWFIIFETSSNGSSLLVDKNISDLSERELIPGEYYNEVQQNIGSVRDYLFLPSRIRRLHSPINSTEISYLAPSKTQITFKCLCPKALIVDDDAFNLTALEMHLMKLKIPCDSAFNGAIAVNKVKERQKTRCCANCQQYSLIFLDYNMPVMDGFETARTLREEIKNKTIDELIIIGCTAFVNQNELDKALQAGMNSYCTKPITPEVVKQKIKEYAPKLLH